MMMRDEEWKEGRKEGMEGMEWNGNALWDLLSNRTSRISNSNYALHACGDFDFLILLHIANIYLHI